MTVWVRAVFGVALLAIVPILLIGLLGGLVVLELVLASHSVSGAVKWLLLTVPAGLVLGRGLLALVRKIDTSVVGVKLTERKQPELWELVRRIAVVAGTEPPDEIYLTADVNAAVLEEAAFLGLVPMRRRMLIGAPLLAAMREDQLAAILTHELAHYSNRDTRLSGLTYRGRRAFVATVAGLHEDWLQKLMRLVLKGFLKLYLRASAGLSRRQERAADEAAARAVGSTVAAGAMRELAAVAESWHFFITNHLVWGWDAGYLPADAFAGYASLRTSTDEELDEIRQNPPDESSPYDTHPPMRQRIAAMEAMNAEPVIEIGHRAAVLLLQDPAAVLDAALFSGLVSQAHDKSRVDWPTLANLHGRVAAVAAAEPIMESVANITGKAPTLRALLDQLDRGHLAVLPDPMPDQSLGRRAQRELARPIVHKGLTAAVHVALADAGPARWQLSWPGLDFVADEPYATELPAALDAAVADKSDTNGLRTLLEGADVDLDHWRKHGLAGVSQSLQLQGQAAASFVQGSRPAGHDD